MGFIWSRHFGNIFRSYQKKLFFHWDQKTKSFVGLNENCIKLYHFLKGINTCSENDCFFVSSKHKWLIKLNCIIMHFLKFFILKTLNFLFLMENLPSIWMGNYKSSVYFIKWCDITLRMNCYMYIYSQVW